MKPIHTIAWRSRMEKAARMNEILTEKDVADLLICEPATVQECARNAELPGLKFGRAWIFPRSALMEFLHSQALARKINKPTAKATKAK